MFRSALRGKGKAKKRVANHNHFAVGEIPPYSKGIDSGGKKKKKKRSKKKENPNDQDLGGKGGLFLLCSIKHERREKGGYDYRLEPSARKKEGPKTLGRKPNSRSRPVEAGATTKKSSKHRGKRGAFRRISESIQSIPSERRVQSLTKVGERTTGGWGKGNIKKNLQSGEKGESITYFKRKGRGAS